jgi:methylenetetrahydrofolate dehydrogenase (NADP+)/methenyltetrahydrofolate cyclohydrolase
MIVDGKKIAGQIAARLQPQPGTTLGILVFPDDRAGQTYSRIKQAAAEKLGIKVLISEDFQVLDNWAKDPAITGILIQYPGWRGENFYQQWQTLVAKIPAAKDVDGLREDSPFTPATVKAVERILQYMKLKHGRIKNSYIIVGRGMVGKALAKKLTAENISSADPLLTQKILQADVVISACGKPKIIKSVKPGAIVIDCGWPAAEADFTAIKDVATALTPVPGGVGPITVACLLENLVQAGYNQKIL